MGSIFCSSKVKRRMVCIETKKESRERFHNRIDLHRHAQIESEVTNIIRSNFSFCVIPIDGNKKRKQNKVGLISAIAQCHQCGPSENWLGQYSPIEKIRESGMWNIQYLFHEPLP